MVNFHPPIISLCPKDDFLGERVDIAYGGVALYPAAEELNMLFSREKVCVGVKISDIGLLLSMHRGSMRTLQRNNPHMESRFLEWPLRERLSPESTLVTWGENYFHIANIFVVMCKDRALLCQYVSSVPLRVVGRGKGMGDMGVPYVRTGTYGGLIAEFEKGKDVTVENIAVAKCVWPFADGSNRINAYLSLVGVRIDIEYGTFKQSAPFQRPLSVQNPRFEWTEDLLVIGNRIVVHCEPGIAMRVYEVLAVL